MATTTDMALEWLNSTQAAAELGITRSAVLKLIARGRLAAIKAGRDHLINRADLDLVRVRPVGRPPKKRAA